MKKWLSLSLAMLMLVGLLPTLAAAEEPAPLFDEPFEISIMATTWAPFLPDVHLWDEVFKRTNVKLNFDWQPQTDFDTKVATVLASGVDAMPDMIEGATISMLLEQEAIVPIDEALAAHGQNILALLTEEDMPYLRQVVDGQIYSLPVIMDLPGSMSTMVRKDWLDRVGKEAPTNWDEFVDVLKAFRDQDANGDGDPNNEIPFALDTAYSAQKGYKGPLSLMQMFGIAVSEDGQFCVLEDGTYTMVYEHPKYKAFLEAYQMLIKEDLMDAEYATRDQAELFRVMDNGTLGMTITWAERARISTDTNREINPEAKWVTIAPIKGPEGAQMIEARAKISNALTFTVAAEKRGKVEKIMQFMDWLFGPEGTNLMNYGIEGVHHDLVDGKPVLKPELQAFPAAREAGLIYQPFVFNWQVDVYMQCLTAGKSYEELSDSYQEFYNGLFKVNEGLFYKRPPVFKTAAYIEFQAELITAVDVLRDKAAAGQITVDDFFAEYAKLKDRGLAQVIEEGNAAWKMVTGQ